MNTLHRLFSKSAPARPPENKSLADEVTDLVRDLGFQRIPETSDGKQRIRRVLHRVEVAAPEEFATGYDRLSQSLEQDLLDNPHLEMDFPLRDPHKNLIRKFVVKWMDRRLNGLDEQIKRSSDTQDRNYYLHISRMLAEMSPNPRQAARARPMAATLRALLMPEAVCTIKGHKPVDTALPPALKRTYSVDVEFGPEKLLREVTFGGGDGTPPRTYLMEKTVMQGGFGKVHMALDPNGERCIIKVERLRFKEGASLEMTVEELLQQHEIQRTLESPLVPREIGIVDDKVYTVQAYYGAGDLMTCVHRFDRRGEPIPGLLLAHLFRFVGAFLQKMRDAGIRHRDIKPDNIFFDPRKGVAVGDFGFAHDGTSEDYNMGEGTHGYMAPETLTTSVDAKEGDAKADIFSFALTLIYLCVSHYRDIPFYVAPDEKSSEKSMNAAIKTYNAWRKARSPGKSEHGPLDWDRIAKGSSGLDRAAHEFVTYAPEMVDIAKYMIESGLVVSPGHRGDDLGPKGEELYPATEEQESQVRTLLESLAELNRVEEAAFHALESHFKGRQEATAEKTVQENATTTAPAAPAA